MGKYLDITKPRYGERILPVPWPFVISRFDCNLVVQNLRLFHIKLTLHSFFSVNLEHNSLTSFGGLVNLINLKVKAI